MEIYLYGAGNRGRILIEMAKKSSVQIVGVVDSNTDSQAKIIDGFIVQTPDYLIGKRDINVCVSYYSTLLHDPIWNKLTNEYGVKKENIYSFNELIKIIYLDTLIPIPEGHNKYKYLFVGNWNMKLGGVESWLRDITSEFVRRCTNNIYLVTDKKNSIYPSTIEKNIVDFAYDKTPQYTPDCINAGIEFIIKNLPCTLIFSRVDELLLSATLVKNKFPDDIRIIMVDHGACDGMTKDIVSYRDEIDSYVAVSRGIKVLLVEQGVNADKIDIMTCPLIYDTSCERISDSTLRIGYAGRLEIFEKRMDILLKLITEIEKSGIEYEFSIAGTGSFLDEMKKFIDVKKLYKKIKLVGQIDRSKIGEFWSCQDIAINVSDNEGRPISNLEAMLYGAVPVVTDTMGSLEDVQDDINGFVVRVGDYEDMAKKIVYLSKNRDIVKTMSEKAQRMIYSKVNMDVHMALWSKVLEL